MKNILGLIVLPFAMVILFVGFVILQIKTIIDDIIEKEDK